MSETNGITVTGTGTVEVAPDTVRADLGVSVLAPTADGAAATAARSANALIEALVGAGVDRTDIRTIGYSLAAEHEWTDQGRRDLGYRAQNTLRARLRDVSTAGSAIDSAVRAAGDTATVNHMEFSIADRNAVESEAREAAWNDAQARATQLAILAGVNLGAPVEVSEVDHFARPPMPMARMAMDTGRPTPVETGSLEVSTSIRARFQIS